jgi:hypothetical protein
LGKFVPVVLAHARRKHFRVAADRLLGNTRTSARQSGSCYNLLRIGRVVIDDTSYDAAFQFQAQKGRSAGADAVSCAGPAGFVSLATVAL